MKKNLTEIICILDRSGSMASLAGDTVGGYNTFIAKQKKEEGEAIVTTVLFDDRYEVFCDRADIKAIADMTERDYYARGCTALYDAVGRTLNDTVYRRLGTPDAEIPERTIVVITTDGLENASREYSAEKVRDIIKKLEGTESWEFLFFGANIDAIGAAESIGIREDRAVRYAPDKAGTATNFEVMADTVACFRSARPIGRSWKRRVEEHEKESR